MTTTAHEMLAGVQPHLEQLAQLLEVWAKRDETKAQPEVDNVWQDANAVIDTIIGDLEQVGALLSQQGHQHWDVADRRVAAYLAESRARRAAVR